MCFIISVQCKAGQFWQEFQTFGSATPNNRAAPTMPMLYDTVAIQTSNMTQHSSPNLLFFVADGNVRPICWWGNSNNCIQSTRLVGYSTTVRAYEDCKDSICQFVPCALCKNVSEASCKFIACFACLVLSWNLTDHEEDKQVSDHGLCSAKTKGQPILCYCEGSATSFSVQKIGTRSTICHNHPVVGIAPPLPYWNQLCIDFFVAEILCMYAHYLSVSMYKKYGWLWQ